MLAIENTLISDTVISEDFVCNISKCKGECCVAGEAGAPLEKEEVIFLEQHYSKIKPYLNKKGIAASAVIDKKRKIPKPIKTFLKLIFLD